MPCLGRIVLRRLQFYLFTPIDAVAQHVVVAVVVPAVTAPNLWAEYQQQVSQEHDDVHCALQHIGARSGEGHEAGQEHEK